MIEISFGKLVLLALIALIVLGPEKLPQAARTAGALLRRVRGGWDSVRAEVERELQIEEIRRAAREATVKAEAAQAELNATLRRAGEPFADEAAQMRKHADAAANTLKQPGTQPGESSHAAAGDHAGGGDANAAAAECTADEAANEAAPTRAADGGHPPSPSPQPLSSKESPHGGA